MLFAASLLLSAAPWSLVLGGDLMLNQIPLKTKPLAGVAAFLQSSSVTIANLESPLTTARKSTPRKSDGELKARSQFLLKADPGFAEQLAAAGIRMVGLANNHCMDYNGEGLAESNAALRRRFIVACGAGANANEAAKIGVFTLPDGHRIGLFSALAFVGTGALRKCSPSTKTGPGINVLNFGGRIDAKARAKILALVARAKGSCDFLVVGLHWGVERKSLPTPYQVQLGRAFVDAGADVVWGNHPHVLQGAEIYNGKPIFYSMGNFVSAMPAETALVKLVYDGATLEKGTTLSCRVSGGRVLPTKKATGTLAKLSKLLVKKYPNKHSIPWKT